MINFIKMTSFVLIAFLILKKQKEEVIIIILYSQVFEHIKIPCVTNNI